MKRLVLDLRGNGGGYLNAAIGICEELLPNGSGIVYTQGRSSPRQDYQADGKGTLTGIPLAVLIDEGSASASEIVAGAVQDNDRGLIVGRRSFGKGLVQEQVDLRDGSAVRLTTARYYTPSGKSIQAKGIVPDVMIDESEEGNVFAALRMREADLDKHLGSGQGEEKKDEAREKAREEARKRLEEEAKKPMAERKIPEFGTDKDFQLTQALNQFKGRPVLVSKTLTERKEEKKEN